MHDYYFVFIFSYVLVVSLLWGLKGAVFLYFLPVALQFHANSALIVLCHSKNQGYRNYETQDRSKNLNVLFKFFLLGEELHNNHHFRPGSATVNVGNVWKEFDPLYYVIKYVLSNSGDIRVVGQK
jgi:stearoyl-CoA desaturase (Delta-9 desaturase)